MKEKLKLLFDYQKFEQNERLSEIIEKAEADSEKKRTELSESELYKVYAAGEQDGNTVPNESGLFPKAENGDDNNP